MIGYIIKRILIAIPLLLAIICINFVIIHSAPGDPVGFMISGVENATPEFMAMKRAELGLDKPMYIQLLIYLDTILHGDLGYSFIYHLPVAQIIAERLQATLLLTVTSFIITVFVGILAGVSAAKKPYSRTDAFFTIGSLGIYSMPDFWVGLIAILVFSVHFNITPIFGMVDPGLSGWEYWELADCCSLESGAPFNDGLTDANFDTSQRMYAIGNWSKFVRSGYYRIDATANPQSEVYVSAFQDTPSGTLVIVAINNGGSNVSQTFSIANGPNFTSVTPWITSASLSLAQQSAISVSANSFTSTLAASSVTTFVGSVKSTPPAPPTKLSATVVH